MTWFPNENNFISPKHGKSSKAKPKHNTLDWLCIIAVCVLIYRDLVAYESFTPEVAFQVAPPYVQILITLIGGGTIRKLPSAGLCRTSGDDQRKNVELLLHLTYWTLTFMSLVAGNWLRVSDRSRAFPENVFQIFFSFIPLLSEINYCGFCTEFRNRYHNLNKQVVNEGLNTNTLLTIRTERKRLNGRLRETAGAWGAQVLSEIATTAATTVYNVHSALVPAAAKGVGGDTVTRAATTAADLLDVLQRALRLFALCKVSGDVADEANRIVTNLLNINPSTDKHLENEVLFFLWEIENPLLQVRIMYNTFEIGPRLFVSVFSWCVGFILILLQFRWPRTY